MGIATYYDSENSRQRYDRIMGFATNPDTDDDYDQSDSDN